MSSIYDKILKNQQNGRIAALCLIVNTKGATPRKSGAKMLVYDDGAIDGTIGGGTLEKAVIEDALEVIEKNEPNFYKHDLLHQHAMCCGGTVQVYIEPIMKPQRLYIFGAGHTGKALAKYACDLGFEVYVIDDRKEYLDEIRIDGVNKMNLPYEKALQALPFDDKCYVSIMTYKHEYDRDILAFCIKQPHAYLGMIGSKRKVEVTKKSFIDAGIATDLELKDVDMPMGRDLNADGPEEIAISIAGRLIEIKNKVHNE